MKEILVDLDRWQREGEEIALATLVCVRGSTPRPAGARLCLTRGGEMAGSVSGGCVENDVFERAMQVLDLSEPAVVNYGIADELGFQVGLSCGGSIDVLIEPFVDCGAWRALRQALEKGRPAALGIGLSPASLRGRKLVVVEEEPAVSSIDAELDADVSAEARRMMASGEATRVLELPWRGEQASVYLESFAPPLQLYIVGATHTAVPLCAMAVELGFRVTVIDPRGPFATRERFPDADALLRAWPDEVLAEAELDGRCYVVTLAHDPKFDLPALAHALRSRARYIGAMGSRATHEGRKARLREQGFREEELDRIRGPVGLDIGARSPEEIAVAILAEVVAVRHGREGGALRDRPQATGGEQGGGAGS
jgi:xanthine dehydrogenase accessory factor